jgi:hypothetical protein
LLHECHGMSVCCMGQGHRQDRHGVTVTLPVMSGCWIVLHVPLSSDVSGQCRQCPVCPRQITG